MINREKIYKICQNILDGNTIDDNTAFELSKIENADLWDLFAAANRVREFYHAKKADLCSIINAKSGLCTEDCSYCAQSLHYFTGAPVYPMLAVPQIAAAAESAKKNGAKRFSIATSGRGIESSKDFQTIAKGIEAIRKLGLFPCATLGALNKEQLLILKQAGLDRYHHNIETSKDFFPRICSTHSFEDRLQVLRDAQDIGLSVCSGGIFGMGESMDERINMAFTLREMKVDSIPINFLMPIQGTPLEHQSPIQPLEALHIIALFRLILPQTEIRVCGGRQRALQQLHSLIFTAGANGLMIGNYLTTSGMDPEQDLNTIKNLDLNV